MCRTFNGRIEILRGFRNLTHYMAKSLLEACGFIPLLHSHSLCATCLPFRWPLTKGRTRWVVRFVKQRERWCRQPKPRARSQRRASLRWSRRPQCLHTALRRPGRSAPHRLTSVVSDVACECKKVGIGLSSSSAEMLRCRCGSQLTSRQAIETRARSITLAPSRRTTIVG